MADLDSSLRQGLVIICLNCDSCDWRIGRIVSQSAKSLNQTNHSSDDERDFTPTLTLPLRGRGFCNLAACYGSLLYIIVGFG